MVGDILAFIIEIMTVDFKIFFKNSFSAQLRGIKCQ